MNNKKKKNQSFILSIFSYSAKEIFHCFILQVLEFKKVGDYSSEMDFYIWYKDVTNFFLLDMG
jgi:hypothetical protein